jgi:nucleotide-binding universal stress UspA family protein
MKIESVFVASHLSEESDEAIRQGDRWARARGAKLTVGFVLPAVLSANPLSPRYAEFETFDLLAAERKASELLTERTLALTGRSEDDVRTVVATGQRLTGILSAAKAARADLIVVGPDSSDESTLAERVARHAPCPVLIARATGGQPSGRSGGVIAGTDLSDPSMPAVRAAIEYGKLRAAPVSVVHAIEAPSGALAKLFGMLGAKPPAPRNTVPEVRARLHAWLDEHAASSAEVIILEGDPAGALLRLSTERELELVVIGTRGWSEEELPLGSVAEIVVRDARCSVLVVRI